MSPRFPASLVEELATAKILGVRAGDTHRFTGVWMVVVDGRVFVRSWNDKPSGWFRAFEAEPMGSISMAGREIAVVGRRPDDGAILRAITAAYAAKYPTKGSEKWVRGFAEAAREATTLELQPA